jgi:hypothetical protein
MSVVPPVMVFRATTQDHASCAAARETATRTGCDRYVTTLTSVLAIPACDLDAASISTTSAGTDPTGKENVATAASTEAVSSSDDGISTDAVSTSGTSGLEGSAATCTARGSTVSGGKLSRTSVSRTVACTCDELDDATIVAGQSVSGLADDEPRLGGIASGHNEIGFGRCQARSSRGLEVSNFTSGSYGSTGKQLDATISACADLIATLKKDGAAVTSAA